VAKAYVFVAAAEENSEIFLSVALTIPSFDPLLCIFQAGLSQGRVGA
jgi:hypothetical protein